MVWPPGGPKKSSMLTVMAAVAEWLNAARIRTVASAVAQRRGTVWEWVEVCMGVDR
jgi:hypothetical protein